MTPHDDGHPELEVTTPLDESGKPRFRLLGITGFESLSQLFQFQFDVLVDGEHHGELEFSELLGQEICASIVLPDGRKRYFHGICNRVAANGYHRELKRYVLEVVPKLWLLTKKAGSRIFQNKSVPRIVEMVLGELGVDARPLKTNHNYEPRHYCVQYRETDFNFLSRLLEEEGIFYFFEHTATGHVLEMRDVSTGLSLVPGEHAVQLLAGKIGHDDAAIRCWQKHQELTAGRYHLRDYTFHRPEDVQQADGLSLPDAPTCEVSNQISLPVSDSLEIYEYPGEFAGRYDDGAKASLDKTRTAKIRIDQETSQGLTIRATSNCANFVCGHTFMVKPDEHHSAAGEYVLTSIKHFARSSEFKNGHTLGYEYNNTFHCIPSSLNYHPPRLARRPIVQGPQTAIVVGPANDEIHVDEMGRVKVKFHWDRDGETSRGDTSCWIRCGTPMAGAGWGMLYTPRVGHEVIVAFEDGHPDRPLIIGSVYNANNQPPKFQGAPTPCDCRTISGLITNSTPGGVPGSHQNEFWFDDKKGSEKIYLHAEKDFQRVIEASETATVRGGDRNVSVELGDDCLTISKGNQQTRVELGKIETEAFQSIELKVGPNSLRIDQAGVWIDALNVAVQGKLLASIHAPITTLTADGAATVNGPLTNILSTGPLVLKGAAAGMTF